MTAAAGGFMIATGQKTKAATSEIHFDFMRPLEGWEILSGEWSIEDVPGASNGKALVQRATSNDFNVIIAPSGSFADVDVSMRFKPISGKRDAAAGIVFRYSDGRYYVIRANALEDNFNLYYYDNSRRKILETQAKAPALGQWHNLRISAEGNRLRGWLNGTQLIDYRDDRFKSGRVGLWTKADSVTAFDEIVIIPTNRG